MDIPKFIYHYFEIEQGPFRNITQNTFEEAKKVQSNISIGFNSKRPVNYIELRFALEKRLKKDFIAKGGNPERNDPFYFTLGKCEWLKSLYENPGFIKIPISELNSKQISFTYPDSMVSFQIHDEPKLAVYKKDYNGKVFLLNELKTLIKKYNLPSEEKWQSQENMKYDRYIEVQVWDNFLIEKYRNKKTKL